MMVPFLLITLLSQTLCHELNILLLTAENDLRSYADYLLVDLAIKDKLQGYPFENLTTAALPLAKTDGSYKELYTRIEKIGYKAATYGLTFGVPETINCDTTAKSLALNRKLLSTYRCPLLNGQEAEAQSTFNVLQMTPHYIPEIGSLEGLLKMLKYDKITLLLPDNDRMLLLAQENMASSGVSIRRHFTFGTGKEFPAIVYESYQRTRVYVILNPPNSDAYVKFLMVMQRMGLLDTGEYAIIVVAMQERVGFTDWFTSAGKTEALPPQLFQNVVTIGPTMPVPERLAMLQQELPSRFTTSRPLLQDLPNSDIEKLKNRTERVTENMLNIYDAITIYADAVRVAVARNITDIGVTDEMSGFYKGKDFTSVDGTKEEISDNGFVRRNISLYAVVKNALENHELSHFDYFAKNYEISEASVDALPWTYRKPKAVPSCGFNGELCAQKIPEGTRNIIIIATVVAGLLMILILFFAIRRWQIQRQIYRLAWQIHREDVLLQETNKRTLSAGSLASISLMSLGSQKELTYTALRDMEKEALKEAKKKHKAKKKKHKITAEEEEDEWKDFDNFAVASHNEIMVGLKRVYKDDAALTSTCLQEIQEVKSLKHDNLNQLKGVVYEPPLLILVYEYCSRHNLQEVIEDDSIKLDDVFFASIIFDIIKGMTFLHKSKIGCHGRLKSTNCLVDAKWQVKLSEFGLWEFRDEEKKPLTKEQQCRSLMWTAPELLRQQQLENPEEATARIWCASPEGDTYSFGVILHELYGRSGVFGLDFYDPIEAIEKITANDGPEPFRPDPTVVENAPVVAKQAINETMNEDPDLRPHFPVIGKMLQPIRAGMKRNIVDNMIAMMEKYTKNLEGIVKDRTTQLNAEKKKSERLLRQMLPESVTNLLKKGQPVPADKFDEVTIYFSDVVGFTDLAAESSPFEVVKFLNDLYTCFDSIIVNYDVYKVETIGDAYMVVSGLPEKNGPHHAGEIASMSLGLLEAIKSFKIRHRPEEVVKLRIGMHTGPCVSGVVGLKMPRYCLFGDTVNMASRMESNGEPFKIHCSEACSQALEKLGGYSTTCRGTMEIKGKGQQKTYWVIGEDPSVRLARITADAEKYPSLKKKNN